jgi:hypothetical protein
MSTTLDAPSLKLRMSLMSTQKRLLYIAGPMTDVPAFNYPAFEAASAYLESIGYAVRSPHRDGLPIDGDTPYETYLRDDLKLMLGCDGIVLLPGWTQSKGAKGELAVALQVGMAVYFLASDAKGLVPIS